MSSRIRPNTYDVYTFITLYQDRVSSKRRRIGRKEVTQLDHKQNSFTVMQFPNLDTILQLNTSTQYYNVIVRLDSIWVDMELVTVAVFGIEGGGMATLLFNS